jgi:hypothetical protein
MATGFLLVSLLVATLVHGRRAAVERVAVVPAQPAKEPCETGFLQ